MFDMDYVAASLGHADLSIPEVEDVYCGKVRDVYKTKHLVVVVSTDRVSAFDEVLPQPIPHKGQVLNQLSAFFLEKTSSLVSNWLRCVPDPHVSIGLRCRPFMVEFIVRGYLLGHAWRRYRAGARKLCGIALPEGLREYDPLPFPLLTPSTKAGHDVDISKEEILARGLMHADEYEAVADHALTLYHEGVIHAHKRGLILADTKYEFGVSDKKIYLIDELHTLDSSRYFDAEVYAACRHKGKSVPHLSKELLRQWILKADKGSFVWSEQNIKVLSDMYKKLYTRLTGKPFVARKYVGMKTRMQQRIHKAMKSIACL